MPKAHSYLDLPIALLVDQQCVVVPLKGLSQLSLDEQDVSEIHVDLSQQGPVQDFI